MTRLPVVRSTPIRPLTSVPSSVPSLQGWLNDPPSTTPELDKSHPQKPLLMVGQHPPQLKHGVPLTCRFAPKS